MTREIKRRKDTGEAGNGGMFGTTSRGESEVSVIDTRPHGDENHVVLPEDQPSGIAEQYEEDAKAALRSLDHGGRTQEIGYSLDAVRAIEHKTSSTYWRYGFRGSSGGPMDHNAGETAHFSGVTAQDADAIFERVPKESLFEDRTRDGPPCTLELLRAAQRMPGAVEVSGSLYSPSREDEGIRAWGLSVYDDELIDRYENGEADGQEIMKHLRLRRREESFEDPSEIRVVENPWRPGERALSVEWDL